jgi:hypothetical protein
MKVKMKTHQTHATFPFKIVLLIILVAFFIGLAWFMVNYGPFGT